MPSKIVSRGSVSGLGARRFLMASLSQATFGWVPGTKYSVLVGQAEQGSWPVRAQTEILSSCSGGVNPADGNCFNNRSVILLQIGEAPVTPEAT